MMSTAEKRLTLQFLACITALCLTLACLANIGGCAVTGSSPVTVGQIAERHQLLFKAATQYTTLKVIEKNLKYTKEIARIAGETANALDVGQLVPLDVVERTVRDKIDWGKLSPEEHTLIDTLISSVRMELSVAEAILATNLAPDEAAKQTLHYTATVLRWIEQIAVARIVG